LRVLVQVSQVVWSWTLRKENILISKIFQHVNFRDHASICNAANISIFVVIVRAVFTIVSFLTDAIHVHGLILPLDATADDSHPPNLNATLVSRSLNSAELSSVNTAIRRPRSNSWDIFRELNLLHTSDLWQVQPTYATKCMSEECPIGNVQMSDHRWPILLRSPVIFEQLLLMMILGTVIAQGTDLVLE
jgi:hypothetical protein